MINIDFQNIKILVIGDVILDVYYSGYVKRISPEAPVPVINVDTVKYIPGGAANVCNNIINLKAKSFLIGFCGNDSYAEILKETLRKNYIDYHLISTKFKTTTKIRIIGDFKQQIARLDFEDEIFKNYGDLKEFVKLSSNNDYNDSFDLKKLKENEKENLSNYYEEIIEFIYRNLDNYEAVIISDYNKGVCSYLLCQEIIKFARKKNKFVIVDPKSKNWEKYNGATIIKPNLKELSDAVGYEVNNEDLEIEKAAKILLKKYDIENIIVTRASKGISLVNNNIVFHDKVLPKEVYDVSGAGDTVCASLTLGFVAGESLKNSISFANRCAQIVVQKFGTVPVTIEDLYEYHFLDEKYKIIEDKEKRDFILRYLSMKNKNYFAFEIEEDFIKEMRGSDLNIFSILSNKILKLKEIKIRDKYEILILNVKKEIYNEKKDLFYFLSNLEFLDFIFIYE